ELDRAGLPQPHLLQRSRSGQPLRSLAGAGALHDRASCRLQVTALGEVVMTGTIGMSTWNGRISDTGTLAADLVALAERAGATISEVEGSHVIMVSQPEAVADVILTAA